MTMARSLVLIIAVCTLSPITFENALQLRVEETVRRFHAPVRYRYSGDGWFEFTDTLAHRTFRMLVTDVRPQGGKFPKKTLTIDVSKLDTTGFGSMFELVSTVPIGTAYNPLIGIYGRDGSTNLIGHLYSNGIHMSTLAYKKQVASDSFRVVHDYSVDQFNPISIGKFRKGNEPQVAGEYGGPLLLFETPHSSLIPVQRFAYRDGHNPAISFPRICDFDKDGLDEIVTWDQGNSIVTSYDTARQRFVDLYASNFNNTMEWCSWAVGDFDIDGKGEFALVTRGGFVFFVEAGATGSSYSIVFIDTTRGQNAGFNTEGNDIDGDGRPECFLGSQFFGGISNIAVYETVGDNDYEVSLWLEIKGIGGFGTEMLTADVDGDGKDELVFNTGGAVLVLRCDGDDSYSPFWLKLFPTEVSVRTFDIDADGAQELLIGRITLGDFVSGYTEIFRFQKPSSAESPPPTAHFSLELISANPATSAVSFQLIASTGSSVDVSLMTMEGKQVVNKTFRQPTFNSQSSTISVAELPPGVYFLTGSDNNTTITRKFIVMH